MSDTQELNYFGLVSLASALANQTTALKQAEEALAKADQHLQQCKKAVDGTKQDLNAQSVKKRQTLNIPFDTDKDAKAARYLCRVTENTVTIERLQTQFH